MKKIVLTLLSIVFSVTLMGQTTFTKDGLSYTVIGGNNVSVKKTQEIVNLVIPSQVENGNTTYMVTEIEENGFFQTNNLRTVSILASVTIGNSAFGNCGNLLEVEGENVTSIGNSAFQGCSSLQSILLPSVTSIGNSAFQSCGELREVDMGVNVTSIGTSAFKECRKLQSILIPSGVTTIADNCFESCERLNEIIISANVTSIGNSAFQNVQTVDKLIFMGCGNNGNIGIATNTFQNCNPVHVEVLCPNGLKFDGSYQNVFGSNAEIHTPCGSASNYNNKGWKYVNRGGCVSTTRQSGYFCLPETWKGYEDWKNNEGSEYPEDATYAEKEEWLENGDENDRYPDFVPRKPDHPFHIASGHTVTLTHVHHIYPYNSINEGVIRLKDNGQLIERDADDNLGRVYMHENLGGVIEIVVPTEENAWNFIGAPFAGYTLGAVKPVSGSDVAMVKYDYTQGKWSDAWATFETPMEAGEGIFAWPFYDGEITFSTYNFGESTNSTYPA
ncbi:MAG: leucine-rich repeat protein, partial [Bacteroidales bacterium]|nr:leucine-rich repeat protein [Bacteroidales bacterium]